MHDPAPFVLTAARDADEPMDKRPRLVTRSRMDDETGRLVYDEQVLVLVRDCQLELLTLRRSSFRRRLELHLLPAL